MADSGLRYIPFSLDTFIRPRRDIDDMHCIVYRLSRIDFTTCISLSTRRWKFSWTHPPKMYAFLSISEIECDDLGKGSALILVHLMDDMLRVLS